MEFQKFKTAASEAGLMMKKKSTVVEPWPLRVALKQEDVGAQEELISCCHPAPAELNVT
jgi:hypothetical protein